MWSSYKNIREWAQEWQKTPFNYLDVDNVKIKTEGLLQVVKMCQKNMVPNEVLDAFKQRVYQYKDTMPVVEALKNTNLKDHHWTEINRIIQKILIINDDFLLNDLLELQVDKKQEEIIEISIQATQENLLEQEFQKQEENWRNLEFKVV